MKVKRELVEEKSEHEKTQLQLSLTREKIQILESEAQILAKQLDREKQTFENAFGLLKVKALSQSSQADDLAAKCAALEALVARQQEELKIKDEQITSLKSRTKDMKITHRKEMADMRIQMQQELFIAKQADRKLSTRNR
jgi:hypothetical protein